MTNLQKIIKIGAICLAIIIIINIFSLLISVFTTFTDINLYTDEGETYKEEYSNVEKIEIDAISSSIIIEEGSTFEVTATNVNKSFSSNLKNKTLKIEENNNFLNLNKTNGKIVITVPTNTILDELSIDTGAGKFTINNIKAREFDLSHGAGLLEITDSAFYETDIDGGAGKITITNTTLNNLELDSGVGQVDIEAFITGNSQISCGVGELNLKLLGNEEEYSIRTEKGIGTIKINNTEQKNGAIYGNGSNKLEIEGGVGSINIDFD